MILSDFTWVTDENIHPLIIEYLRQLGITVIDAQEQQWQGFKDYQILEKAVSVNAIILTHDSDYGMLAIQKNLPIIGAIHLRPGHVKADQSICSLEALFQQNLDVDPPFIISVKQFKGVVSIRVRQLE